MKTLTSIQTLATLAALGTAVLLSATPADAHFGGRAFGGFTRAARQEPPAVLAAQLAHPGHVNTGSTSMICDTPSGPVFCAHGPGH